MTNKDINRVERNLRDFPSHKLSQSSEQTIYKGLMENVAEIERRERKAYTRKKAAAGFAGVAVLALFVVLGLTTNLADPPSDSNNIESMEEAVPEQPIQETAEFNKETAKEVMADYKQAYLTVVEAADPSGDITSFAEKEDIISHLSEAMSDEHASELVDSYFKEADGKLHLVSKDSPVWLLEEKDFQIKRVDDRHYMIIQERENELLGHRRMVYHSQIRQGKWVITSVESLQEPEASIQEQALTVIQAIAEKNMDIVAEHVHSDKGLLFSPSVNINENPVIFEKGDIGSLLNADSVYTWGHYDGSGERMALTPGAYFEEVLYAKPYQDYDEVLVDTFEPRGNTRNNLKDVFPDAKVVEFYLSGSEEYDGMDWASLNLIFEKDENGVWKLTGLVNDKWSI
ncbi:hypothetical protein [Bacillus sp. AK031]